MSYPGKAEQLTNREFEKLFRENYLVLKMYAKRYVTDTRVAEDLIQDVFFNIWKKRDDLNITTSLRSYFFASLHNACINYLKSNKIKTSHVNPEVSYDELINATYHQTVLENSNSIYEQEFLDALQKSIDGLPEQCRNVFHLSRFECLKNREIAEKLDISVKAVEKHITKALGHLRKDLGEFLPHLLLLAITRENLPFK